MSHKAGFVSIIGRPNVGKSTLMNRLIGETLSIVTPKAQTTRHRIKGILNADDYQIVFSDTPQYAADSRAERYAPIVRTSLRGGGCRRERQRASPRVPNRTKA